MVLPDHLHPHPLPIQTPKLTLACPVLDRLLNGGIPCNSITEIVAESGTGKTQLSLQLLLSAQLPISYGGLSASSLYLHSEFPFPTRRLHQLSLPYKPYLNHNPLDHIFVQPLYSADNLLDLLPRLDSLIPTLNIKLIVIDSIAALFRGEFDNTPGEWKRRSGIFFKVSSRLRFFGVKFGVAVVCTNQVMDVMDNAGDRFRVGNGEVLCTSGRRVCAALGLSWANCVNTRLFMWREEEGGEDGGVQVRRFVRVVFAPHLPDGSCEFVVSRDGVYGIDRPLLLEK